MNDRAPERRRDRRATASQRRTNRHGLASSRLFGGRRGRLWSRARFGLKRWFLAGRSLFRYLLQLWDGLRWDGGRLLGDDLRSRFSGGR